MIPNWFFGGIDIVLGSVFLFVTRCFSTNPNSALKVISDMWKFSKNTVGLCNKFSSCKIKI